MSHDKNHSVSFSNNMKICCIFSSFCTLQKHWTVSKTKEWKDASKVGRCLLFHSDDSFAIVEEKQAKEKKKQTRCNNSQTVWLHFFGITNSNFSPSFFGRHRRRSCCFFFSFGSTFSFSERKKKTKGNKNSFKQIAPKQNRMRNLSFLPCSIKFQKRLCPYLSVWFKQLAILQVINAITKSATSNQHTEFTNQRKEANVKIKKIKIICSRI